MEEGWMVSGKVLCTLAWADPHLVGRRQIGGPGAAHRAYMNRKKRRLHNATR